MSILTGDDPTERSQSNGISWVFVIAFAVLVITKIVLVAHHEIVATGRAHDDLWQVLSADFWYWRRPYDFMAFIHLPIYPLSLAVVSQTGIPLRIVGEAVYLLSAASFAVAWGRVGVPRWAQLAAFGVIAFHPYGIDLLDCAFAENLYATLMLLAGGQFVRILAYRNRRDLLLNAVFYSVLLALAWHTRKEATGLLGGLLAVSLAGVVLAWLLRKLDLTATLKYAASLVAGPAILVVALGAVLASVSGTRFGLWATNELGATNYVRAFQSLQQIDAPSNRFIPISKAAREMAYEVSPAFAELRWFLEESDGAKWTRHEAEMFAGTSDLYAGNVYWLLRDALQYKGYYKTAATAQAFYGRIADEIQQAFRDGRLKKRWVPVPFIDPNLSAWLPYFPASLYNVSTLLFAKHPSQCAADSLLPSNIIELFDRVANRRTPPPVEAVTASVEGSFSTSGSPIKRFDLVGHDLVPVQATADIRSEPATDNKSPSTVHFKLDWPFRHGLTPYGFRIERENGAMQLTPGLEHVPLNAAIPLESQSTDSLQMQINKLQEPPPKTSWRKSIETKIAGSYDGFMRTSVWIALAALVAILALLRRWPLSAMFTIALSAMLLIIVSRVVLFGILDASAWSGMQPRYIFPVAGIAVALPFLVLGQLWRYLRDHFNRQRRAS